MSSSFIASGVGRKAALVLAGALTVALAISLGNVAESSGSSQAVAAKKKCKKKGKKSAVAAKKCKKPKVVAPVAPPPPPAPLALTEGEVRNQVAQKAAAYCLPDPDCFAYGIYVDGAGNISCESKSTYSWSCYGYNDEDYEPDGTFDETCDFKEVVSRVGYSGISSYQDLSFGGTGPDAPGWSCGPYTG